MQRALFKAKRSDGKGWVEGWYCKVYFGTGLQPAIIPIREGVWEPVRVDEDTLCQFTGATDKTGKQIFDYDIVKTPSRTAVVTWNNDRSKYRLKKGSIWYSFDISDCEVIGNKFDEVCND